MTSKNILFIGTMLFALLVTSCVAYFLERYNPMIETVTYTQSEQRTFTPVIIVPEPNATLPIPHEENLTTAAAIVTEKNVTRPVILPKKVLPEANKTVPKISEPVATKINRKIVPKKQKPKRPAHVKYTKKTKPAVNNKNGIVIEPVLMTKTLQVSRNGRLGNTAKALLRSVARKIKAGKDRYILLSTPGITAAKRGYLKQIKAYLLHKGVKPQQIKIKITRVKSGKKYVSSDTQKDTIELSLLERI